MVSGIVVGILKEQHSDHIVLTDASRVPLPDGLVLEHLPSGSRRHDPLQAVTVLARWSSRSITQSATSHPTSPTSTSPRTKTLEGRLKRAGASPSGGGGPLLWTVALLPPSPLEGVSQALPHAAGVARASAPIAPNQHDGQYEPDRETQNRGTCAIRRRTLLNHLVAPCTSDGDRQAEGLGVLRLITRSNFVGCSTAGRTGLAPLRIRST